MNIHGLTKETEQALVRAGWFQDREADIRWVEENLEKLGYTVFPAARQFLEALGDLTIQGKKGSISFIAIDRPEHQRLVDLGFIEAAENDLCLVGYAEYDSDIFIDASGRLYMYALDSYLGLVSETIGDSLNRLVKGDHPLKTLYPQNDDMLRSIFAESKSIVIIGDLHSRKFNEYEHYLKKLGFETHAVHIDLKPPAKELLLGQLEAITAHPDLLVLMDWLGQYRYLVPYAETNGINAIWVEHLSVEGLAERKQSQKVSIVFGPMIREHKRLSALP